MMLSHPIEVSLESALNYIVSLGCNLIFLLFLLGLKYRSKEKEISRKETNLQRKKKKKRPLQLPNFLEIQFLTH